MIRHLTEEQLIARERELLSALAEFEHEARRIRDRLERSGGHSLILEAEFRRLNDNLELTRRDLERVQNQRMALGDGRGE